MAEALLLACHLVLGLVLLTASLAHLVLAAASHLSPSASSPLLRTLRHPLLRLLPPLLALPLPFLPIAGAAADVLPLLALPPLLLLLPLPFLPPLLLHRPLLSLPLLLLTRAASLLSASFPSSDLQQHTLAVAGLVLLAGAAASLASSLASPRSSAHFAAEAMLACAGAVGGLWAAQTGLSLYVDACVPTGCHRLIGAAPATRCDVEEARLRAVGFMDLALSVHCIVVAAVAAGVCLGVARWCGVDGGAGNTIGRKHNGSSYDALPSVASSGVMAEMEHLPVKNVGGKSVAQE
jgi:hypothetical protein